MKRTLDKLERLDKANAMIEHIASVGQKFFAHKNISRLSLDSRGRVWLCDGYSGKMVYAHYERGSWRGFTEGGTLRSLIIHFRDFICHAKPLPRGVFGPWPDWCCNGDLWGYGAEAMQSVRDHAESLGLIKAPEKAVA